MIFLPDTNTCISLLRQKQPRLIERWQSTKVTDRDITTSKPLDSRNLSVKIARELASGLGWIRIEPGALLIDLVRW